MNLRLRVLSSVGVMDMYPGDIDKLKEVTTRNDDYRIELKKSFQGTMIFKGDEYFYFKQLEQGNYRCSRIEAQLQQYCQNEWKVKRMATILLRDGQYDDALCSVTFPLSLNEPYRDYDDNKDKEYNLLDSTIIPFKHSAHHDNIDGEIPNGVLAYEALSYMLNNALGISDIRSDFFQWGADNPAYTKGDSSKLQKLMIFQKSDAIRRNIDGYTAATVMTMTIDKLVTGLCKKFNLKYRIDEAGTCRIEHYTWWTRTLGLDLTQPKYKDYMAGTDKWEYKSTEYYRQEKYTEPETHYKDFIGAPIEYNNGCVVDVLQTTSIEVQQDFMTDIEWICAYDPEDTGVDLDGVILIAVDDSYVVQTDTSYIEGTVRANNVLSWASVHQNFFKDGRLFTAGKMNFADEVFTNQIRLRVQKKVLGYLCCDEQEVNLFKYVRTSLGDGIIDSLQYTFSTGYLDMEILHENPVNYVYGLPAPVEDFYWTKRNQSLNTLTAGKNSLLANDVGAVSVYAEKKPTLKGGMVDIKSNGHFIYYPPLEFYGMDEFYYAPINGAGKSSLTKCKIAVRWQDIYVHLVELLNVPIVDTDIIPNFVDHWTMYYAYWYKDAAKTQPLDVTGYGFDIIFHQDPGSTDSTTATGIRTYLRSPFDTGTYPTFSIQATADYSVV